MLERVSKCNLKVILVELLLVLMCQDEQMNSRFMEVKERGP